MGAPVLVKATARIKKRAIKAGDARGGTLYVNHSRPAQDNRAISMRVESDKRLDILPQQIKALITVQWRFSTTTALLFVTAEVLTPYIGSIFTLTTMPCKTCTHTTNDGGIDGCSCYNDLPFRECGKIIQQITSNAFNCRSHAFLVNLVDNTHNTLCLTLT